MYIIINYMSVHLIYLGVYMTVKQEDDCDIWMEQEVHGDMVVPLKITVKHFTRGN
jgi:hypothetical protein